MWQNLYSAFQVRSRLMEKLVKRVLYLTVIYNFIFWYDKNVHHLNWFGSAGLNITSVVLVAVVATLSRYTIVKLKKVWNVYT